MSAIFLGLVGGGGITLDHYKGSGSASPVALGLREVDSTFFNTLLITP